MASCCPKTFTGFCLEDNTPIAVTIDNGVLISWTNLVTGTVTVGNPPAGTGICEIPSTVTVETEIAPLTCEKDAVTICPGDDPIPVTAVDFDIRDLLFATDKVDVSGSTVNIAEPVTVDGMVALDAPTLAALETIIVNQGTSPWVVSGTVAVTEPVTVDAVDLDIRNLLFATDKVDVSGSTVTVAEPVTVDAVDLDTRNLVFATDKVDVSGSTVTVAEPVTVDGTVALDAPTLAALETITVDQGTSPWVVAGTVAVTEPVTVDAVDLDTRDLVFATDKVDVSGSMVTVAEPVTVDAVDLDTRDLVFATDKVDVSGSTVTVNEPVTVDAVDLDTRDLTFATDKVDASGSTVEISNDIGNPIPVSGTVTLDAPTLAALETITVDQGTSPWVVSGTLGVTGEVEVKNDAGSPLPIDDAQSNKRFQPGVRLTTAIAIASLGNNTIITPSAGMRLRVTWIGMSSSEVGLETLAIIKFGAAGASKYRWYMGAPGAFSHWEAIEGAVDEALIVNLSIGVTVQVSLTYEEFA